MHPDNNLSQLPPIDFKKYRSILAAPCLLKLKSALNSATTWARLSLGQMLHASKVISLAENLRVEVWGPFLTVSGTRKGGAMGMRDPAPRSTAQRSASGGKGVVLRRETDYGFFSASWRLPVCRFSMLLDLGLLCGT